MANDTEKFYNNEGNFCAKQQTLGTIEVLR